MLVAVAVLVACGALVGADPEQPAPTAADGGVDGAVPTDDAEAPDGGCGHMLCADFEGASLYGFERASPALPAQDGGWFVTSTDARGGARALGTFVYPGQVATLEKQLDAGVRRVVVEAYVKLGPTWDAGAFGKANPLTIHCENGGDNALLKISDQSFLASNGPDDAPIARFLGGRWVHVRLAYDADKNEVRGTVTRPDGSDAGQGTIAPKSGCSGKVSVRVGDEPPSDSQNTFELYVDDVTVDWQ